MGKIKRVAICGLVVSGVFFWLLPSAGEAVTINVDCSVNTIQAAIDLATPGDTISVTGICNENVSTNFKSGLTLDGNATAVIHGPNATKATVEVRAAGTTIKRFKTISGGQDGVQVFSTAAATVSNNTVQNTARDGVNVSGSSASTVSNNTIQSTGRDGVHVSGNSVATIDTNTVQTTARDGVHAVQSSAVTITNNTITGNPGDGIHVADGSTARVGFSNDDDTVASPNTITSNEGDGIDVSENSNGRIVGNTISQNTGSGVAVIKGSHADISGNTINQNGFDGVEVSQGSGADLGSDTGIFASANTTTTKNTNKGIECSIGGYVNGSLGSLNGAKGAKTVNKGCFNSLGK